VLIEKQLAPLRFSIGAVCLAVYLALAFHSEYWLGVVTTHPIGDDFKIYYGAYFKALKGENPYEPYGIGSGFINHPATLSFVSLFAWSNNQQFSTYLWTAVSAGAWLVSVGLALSLARQALSDEGSPAVVSAGRTWLVSILFAGFAPLWETLHIGQVNPFAILATLLCLFFARRERAFLAGLALAAAIVLKTSPIILAAYFVVRFRFRILTWTLVSLALLTVLAAAQFSPVVLRQFWQILPRLSLEVYPDSYNQSVISVLYRSLSAFTGPGLKEVLTAIHSLALVMVAGPLLLTGLAAARLQRQLDIWLFMALAIIAVVFSPLVWYHHSTFLLLPLMALLVSPRKAVFVLGLGLVFVLQGERLFEQFVTLTAYPVVISQLCLLAVVVIIYLNGRNGPVVWLERLKGRLRA
jgi:alpha-1,2-mannosyltransferase